KIALWRPPQSDGVRVDAGVESGDTVSPYYDPMIAKISAHGSTRDEALRRLDAALRRTILFGVRSNLDYVRRVLLHPDHRAGHITTAFLEAHAADLLPTAVEAPVDGLTSTQLAALAITLQRLATAPSPVGWRNNRSRPLLEKYRQAHGHDTGSHDEITVRLTPERDGRHSLWFHDESQTHSVRVSGASRTDNLPDLEAPL